MQRRTRARARLLSQSLVGAAFPTAEEAVGAFGLMQGQETTVFSSVALRSGGAESVRAALAENSIVRAYPMRGTVFLGLAREMRWMTQLLAKPGVPQTLERLSRIGVTAAHTDAVREEVLARGRVTNTELREIVARITGVSEPAATYRTRYLLLVEGTCAYLGPEQSLGPAPPAPGLEKRFNGERQAAVDELVRRYVATRGPVRFEDVTWWSKLPVREVRTALEHLGEGFAEIDGDFMSAGLPDLLASTPPREFRVPLLLPAFDEYILGYKNRLFAMTDEVHAHLVPSNMGVFRKAVVVDGVVRGSWKGAGGVLEVEDTGGVPKYAEAGIRRAFRSFPRI